VYVSLVIAFIRYVSERSTLSKDLVGLSYYGSQLSMARVVILRGVNDEAAMVLTLGSIGSQLNVLFANVATILLKFVSK
jgi:hypothetical protein